MNVYIYVQARECIPTPNKSISILGCLCSNKCLNPVFKTRPQILAFCFAVAPKSGSSNMRRRLIAYACVNGLAAVPIPI